MGLDDLLDREASSNYKEMRRILENKDETDEEIPQDDDEITYADEENLSDSEGMVSPEFKAKLLEAKRKRDEHDDLVRKKRAGEALTEEEQNILSQRSSLPISSLEREDP